MILKRFYRPVLVFLLALFFPVIANASPVADFACDVKPHPQLQADGYLLGERIYLLNDEMVGLTAYPEPSQTLPRVPSGSGMRFSNDAITFAAKGDEGFLELQDGTLFPCRYVRVTVIAPAQALGSVIRQQPAVTGAKIQSLPLGEPVSIIEETGIYIDDYQWFKVEYSEGFQGYAWGGTLCVDTEMAGILIGCDRLIDELSRSASGTSTGGNATSNEGPIFAQSLFGTKVREKADANARQIDSISKGTALEIIRETGSFFDGWQWVRVRYDGNREGFAWGGTLCISAGRAITGVHESCEP